MTHPLATYRAVRALQLGRALSAIRRGATSPAEFADGDQVVHAGIAWVRSGGEWTEPAQPCGVVADDQAMRVWWDRSMVLRYGRPQYTPASQ